MKFISENGEDVFVDKVEKTINPCTTNCDINTDCTECFY